MRVLVTGGLGFIGSHLVEKLLGNGHEVAVIDDGSSGKKENLSTSLGSRNLAVTIGDIRSRNSVRACMRDVGAVVHLAALVSVRESVKNPGPTTEVNLAGTLAVLEESIRAKVSKFVFASSAAVYGEARPPVDEARLPSPLSPYAASKVAGEAYCSAFHEAYGLEAVSLRLFNVYGARGNTGPYGGVMAKFARATFSKKPLTVYGDGKQTRDFVHVSDVVEAICSALTTSGLGGEKINIGTGAGTTVNQLAGIFLRSADSMGLIHAKSSASEIRNSVADISLAKSKIGFRPRVKLEQGVDDYLKWYSRKLPTGDRSPRSHGPR